MGLTQSTPLGQQILNAARNNKPHELAKLVALLHQSRRGIEEKQALEWRDKAGRTPLIICARENRTACAQVLLQAGCDVHYVNRMPDARGSALHEAAHKDADAMVALLLQFGACPWVANAYGRTALDEAVLGAAAGPVWRFKQLALHYSSALVKTSRLGGLSNPYKQRALLVIPYYPLPQAGKPPPPPRKQLWFYTDDKMISPKVRVWLDGASILLGPRETLLRLHPSHAQPDSDLHLRWNNGFCISLRPINMLPTTLTVFQHLLTACSPSTIPAGAPWHGVQGAASPLTSLDPMRPQPRPPTPPPATGPLPATPPRGVNAPPAVCHSRGPSQASTGMPEAMHALPGESDDAFAARLAAMMSDDAPSPPHPAGTQTPPPRPQPTPPATPPRGHATPPAHHYPPIPGAQELPEDRPPAAGAAGVEPSVPGEPETPTAPPLQSTPETFDPQFPGAAPGPGGVSLPFLLSQQAQQDPVHTPSNSQGSDNFATFEHEDSQCIICMSGPRECGFLHGASMHLCVCRECKKTMPPGSACPLCRQTIERVIDVF